VSHDADVDALIVGAGPVGLYAAGDITDYPGKVRLIAVGFGEAATAVNNAVAALDPGAPLFPGHSSDLAAGRAAASSLTVKAA
jgi:ferredoxin/flavodoxin---NADP+ reductase